MDVDTVIAAISGILAETRRPGRWTTWHRSSTTHCVQLPEKHAGKVPPEGQALYWMTKAHYHEYQSALHHESLVATEKELTVSKQSLVGREKEIAAHDQEITNQSKEIPTGGTRPP